MPCFAQKLSYLFHCKVFSSNVCLKFCSLMKFVFGKISYFGSKARTQIAKKRLRLTWIKYVFLVIRRSSMHSSLCWCSNCWSLGFQNLSLFLGLKFLCRTLLRRLSLEDNWGKNHFRFRGRDTQRAPSPSSPATRSTQTS